MIKKCNPSGFLCLKVNSLKVAFKYELGFFAGKGFSEFLSENVLNVFGTHNEQSKGRIGSGVNMPASCTLVLGAIWFTTYRN